VKAENFDERVCRTQPFCKCVDISDPDPYTCNCLRGPSPSVCCRVCGVKLVPVERYEKMMAQRKHTRKKTAP